MRLRGPDSNTPLKAVLLLQGLYYVVTGIWPLVWLESFLWVVGPKPDLFQLRTTTLLITVIGAVLMLGARQRRPSADVVVLGIATAAVLALVELWHIETLRLVYLADAAVEFVIAGALLAAWSRRPG